MVKRVLDVYIHKKDRYISNVIPKFNDQNNIVLGQNILGETFHNQLKIYLGNHQ